MQPSVASTNGAGSAVAYAPVPLVEGSLYAVGGMVPLDGRVSWAPAEARGFQPSNCYLVLDGDSAVIVDPGLPYVERGVLDGLRACLPEGMRPAIFVTRAQLDNLGNLGAVAGAFDIRSIFAGGQSNPFDQFDAARLADEQARAVDVPLERVPVGRAADPDRILEIVAPPLRILATFWAYHAPTKVLFTSDAFSHVVRERPDASPVVTADEVDRTTVDDVRAHLSAAFWWLPTADRRALIAMLRDVFETHEVDVIAPGRGAILAGRPVVERHLELMLDVLEDPAFKEAA
jgi:glyoxylase-like metal-dependent hydrolase (beta-lactamase superfamily II)